MPPEPLLKVRDVAVRFGGIIALAGVSAEVGPGEVVALIGPNGAGKTTLLNVISGTQRAVTGTVFIDGEDLGRKMPVARARTGIGRTFQRADLFRELTALDHLMIGYAAGRKRLGEVGDQWRTREQLREIARKDTSPLSPYALITRLDLEPYRDLPAMEIPLGPARLVEIGRALCSRPKVLLLDEPVSGLDKQDSLKVASILREFTAETQMAVFVVEHDLTFAQAAADRLVALDFGQVLVEGPPSVVMASKELQAAYLGSAAAEHAPAPVTGAEDDGADAGGPITTIVTTPAEQESAASVLELSDVTVEYHGVAALRDVSLRLEPGTITAVLGPNGAGKTTLANVIGGFVRARRGTIMLGDTDVTSQTADARARSGIGLLPDTRAIFPALTVAENLRMGFRTKDSGRSESIDAAMNMFPILRKRSKQRAGSLSGGEQQMLAIARLAVRAPAVLVIDEMSHGLAPLIVDELFALIESFRGRTTVLLIEQFVGRAINVAERVIVLRGGTVLLDAPTSDIDEDRLVDLYLLEGQEQLVDSEPPIGNVVHHEG